VNTAALGRRAAIDVCFYLLRRFDVKGADKTSKRHSFFNERGTGSDVDARPAAR
jgi:hypothetical protein